MRVTCLPWREVKGYKALLAEAPMAMMTHCPAWLSLLEALTGSAVLMVAAYVDERLVGALPCVLSPDLGAGRVLNSLPFFGSHGGPIRRRDQLEPDILLALITHFDSLAMHSGCRASTMILSPSEPSTELLRQLARPDEEDLRMGQIALLPDDAEAILPMLVEGKRRNNIRNAQRKGVTVHERHDTEAVEWLRSHHEAAMGQKNGQIKPALFFDWAQRSAQSAGLCSFLFAEQQDRIIAGALLAHFAECWEYLVPASDAALQNYNGLSLIIYEGMRKAVQCGAKRWNFGGTWVSQQGVYQFKEQFGATNHPYHYFVKIHDHSLTGLSSGQLAQAFPYFYSIPYRTCAS